MRWKQVYRFGIVAPVVAAIAEYLMTGGVRRWCTVRPGKAGQRGVTMR